MPERIKKKGDFMIFETPYTILYYDSDENTRREFVERHKGNQRIKIDDFGDISTLLDRIDKHRYKPIDLILIDFYSNLPLVDIEKTMFERYKPKENENSKKCDKNDVSNSDICKVNQLILDFQSHKDSLNQKLDRVWIREGINAVDTLHDYFEYKGINDIPLAIYSMLGRRLISSKDASRLQSKGVMWVWKSKEKLIDNEEYSNKPDANAEFDSIQNAIVGSRLRNTRVREIKGIMFESIIVQVLTLCALVLSVYFHYDQTSSNELPFDSLFSYFAALIVITVSTVTAAKAIYKLFWVKV